MVKICSIHQPRDLRLICSVIRAYANSSSWVSLLTSDTFFLAAMSLSILFLTSRSCSLVMASADFLEVVCLRVFRAEKHPPYDKHWIIKVIFHIPILKLYDTETHEVLPGEWYIWTDERSACFFFTGLGLDSWDWSGLGLGAFGSWKKIILEDMHIWFLHTILSHRRIVANYNYTDIKLLLTLYAFVSTPFRLRFGWSSSSSLLTSSFSSMLKSESIWSDSDPSEL